MPTSTATSALQDQLSAIPHLTLLPQANLRDYTRFGIGGPADLLIDTNEIEAFLQALAAVRGSTLPFVVIGGGTNLVVADSGFRGVVLRYLGDSITRTGDTTVTAQAGATLQSLVDFCNREGLQGLETMTGIPGSVGAAIYGNAGAYGHSIAESTQSVQFYDGDTLTTFDNAACQFHYRHSTFKEHKDWIVFTATLALKHADAAELQAISERILSTRNKKYPPTMKCAGSIFKNFLWSELPEAVQHALPANVIIEGKVPSAYFLDQVGAKGLQNGDIHVADYHANLIYNVGSGTAAQLREVIQELQKRVQDRFGIHVEEEVQYVGF